MRRSESGPRRQSSQRNARLEPADENHPVRFLGEGAAAMPFPYGRRLAHYRRGLRKMGSRVTGPISPEGRSGESFVYMRMLVHV
jgi:hypothetical protein